MSSQGFPLVSIGMPLYNEEEFIRETLSSLLSQDYQNVEIIVSDNASTDNTRAICDELGNTSNKIKLHKQSANLGVSHNFNFVLEESSGKYFMWASGHDLWAPNYISECVKQLEDNPTAVVSFGSSDWIDQDGKIIRNKQYGWIDTRGLDIFSRYIVTFWGNMHPILGVINREELVARKTISAVGTDLIILCRLALRGNFIHAFNTHWSRREFRHETSYQEKIKRYKSKEFGLIKSKREKFLPLARLPVELCKDIIQSNLRVSEKFSILILLLFMLPFRYIAGKKTNKQ